MTADFQATRPAVRSAFVGLAAAITFTLLASLGAVADHQVAQAQQQLAQSAPLQVAASAVAPRS